jgi:hypothetical protein
MSKIAASRSCGCASTGTFINLCPLHLAAADMAKALKPFADFMDAFDAAPIAGLSPDEVYSIHGGEHVKPNGASIKWEHLRAARAVLKRTKEKQ